MWDRLASLATVALACVGLAMLSGCDAVKYDGQTRRGYRRVLVEELCAPGEFYSECVWSSYGSCYEEMPFYVENCIPSELDRVQPSAAFRESMLECVFDLHFMFPILPVEETEECLDATRWKHILPGQKHKWAEFQRNRIRWFTIEPQSVPATTDTPPEPSPGTAPEPAPAP